VSLDSPYSRADIVRAWTTDGWDASQAAEWISAGWRATPDEQDLEAERDYAFTAAAWRDAGYVATDALAWDLAGTTPKEATAWAEGGYTAAEACAVVGECQVAYNLDPERGRPADRPRDWRETGLPAARILLCIRAGVSAREAVALPLDDVATDDSLEVLAALRAPVPH
jgi:hypothetical protein